MRDIHERVKHNGIRDTLTTTQERYWIIRGREFVEGNYQELRSMS